MILMARGGDGFMVSGEHLERLFPLLRHNNVFCIICFVSCVISLCESICFTTLSLNVKGANTIVVYTVLTGNSITWPQ